MDLYVGTGCFFICVNIIFFVRYNNINLHRPYCVRAIFNSF